MSLSEQDVDKIAHLARLSLDHNLKPEVLGNLNNILNLVETINSCNTDDVSPMSHSNESQVQRMATDEITEKPDRNVFQKIAPKTEAGLYLVSKVIEE